MSGKRSRNKGANGEREFARLVQSYGFDCERTGRNGRTAEDVTHSVPGWHFEVKRRETLCVPEWVRQAHADADGLVPAVAFRRNRTSPTDPLGQWHAIQPCADLFRLLAEVRDLRAEVEQLERELRVASRLRATLLAEEEAAVPVPESVRRAAEALSERTAARISEPVDRSATSQPNSRGSGG